MLKDISRYIWVQSEKGNNKRQNRAAIPLKMGVLI